MISTVLRLLNEVLLSLKTDLNVLTVSTVIVPRMYALFFHRLSILERATDHKCIEECSYSKRNMGRIKCSGPDDQEPEEEVRGEVDHPQGSYSQKAANDRSCDWERQS